MITKLKYYVVSKLIIPSITFIVYTNDKETRNSTFIDIRLLSRILGCIKNSNQIIVL